MGKKEWKPFSSYSADKISRFQNFFYQQKTLEVGRKDSGGFCRCETSRDMYQEVTNDENNVELTQIKKEQNFLLKN